MDLWDHDGLFRLISGVLSTQTAIIGLWYTDISFSALVTSWKSRTSPTTFTADARQSIALLKSVLHQHCLTEQLGLLNRTANIITRQPALGPTTTVWRSCTVESKTSRRRRWRQTFNAGTWHRACLRNSPRIRADTSKFQRGREQYHHHHHRTASPKTEASVCCPFPSLPMTTLKKPTPNQWHSSLQRPGSQVQGPVGRRTTISQENIAQMLSFHLDIQSFRHTHTHNRTPSGVRPDQLPVERKTWKEERKWRRKQHKGPPTQFRGGKNNKLRHKQRRQRQRIYWKLLTALS